MPASTSRAWKQATGGMLSRLDELEGELSTLLDALRRSGERLNEGLAAAAAEVGAFGGESRPPRQSAAAAGPRSRAAEPADEAGASRNGDEAGARLIALNMALSGTPREETAAYLAEHYDLADPEALLDDVYSRAGPVNDQLAALRRHMAELSDLCSVGGLLFWDQQTMMPPGGARHRAEAAGTLARVIHARETSPELGALLAVLEPWAAEQDPDSDDARLVWWIRRDYEKSGPRARRTWRPR